MAKRELIAALAELRAEDLWPAWRVVDLQEQLGVISRATARRWKEGIYRRLLEIGLEPEDLVSPLAEPERVQ